MNKQYQTSLYLGSQDRNEGPSISQIAEECMRWIEPSWGCGALTIQDLTEPRSRIEHAELDGRATLDFATIHNEGTTLFGFRLQHPDCDDKDSAWRTEIVCVDNGESGPLAFSCVNRFGSTGGNLQPVLRNATRPRIVSDLVQQYGGFHGLPLSSMPKTLYRDGVAAFMEDLESPERTRPLIFVSARNSNDKPVVDPERLASQLVGLAHVVVGEGRWPSLALRDHLPQRINCWNGAVRIYWPGFQVSDSPFRHPVWSPEDINGIAQSRRRFETEILSELVRVSVSVADKKIPLWTQFTSAVQAATVRQLKESGDESELLELYEAENGDLLAQISDLDDELAAVKHDLFNANHELIGWRRGLRGEVAQSEGDAESIPSFSTVGEVLDFAQEHFQGDLIFSLNKQSDGESSMFEDCDGLFYALKFLATTYRQARLGEVTCADFNHAIKQEVGWSYAGGQSGSTIGKFRNWYEASWNGQKYDVLEHVGTGSSKDPRRSIRVAFVWLEEEGKVLIGYLGQHQRTQNT
jgi:hypothetical protein